MHTRKTRIQCTACGQSLDTIVYTYIDAENDPQAKFLLMSGRLHRVPCPNCGTTNHIAAPLLYHDPAKGLLIAYVPIELNLPQAGQEKVIGDLLNKMPKETFKGYMFNPRRSLTLQGVIDQILEADGVTPEMIEQQREYIALGQKVVETQTKEELVDLVEQYDDQIDQHVFQVLAIMAQRVLEEGQPDLAQSIVAKQNIVAEVSTYGQEMLRREQERQRIIEEVGSTLQRIGPKATRADFLDLAIRYANAEDYLQMLVSLARPAFDYQFFQELTQSIQEATAEEHEALMKLRESLLELTATVDQQIQAAMQGAALFLQAIVSHPQPEEFIRENLRIIDDTFMAVLAANIQQAENAKDQKMVARLKEVFDMVVNILQENMQPELRFINELLATEDDGEAAALIHKHAGEFNDTLFEVLDAVEQVLEDRGDRSSATRLKAFRAEVAQALS